MHSETLYIGVHQADANLMFPLLTGAKKQFMSCTGRCVFGLCFEKAVHVKEESWLTISFKFIINIFLKQFPYLEGELFRRVWFLEVF